MSAPTSDAADTDEALAAAVAMGGEGAPVAFEALYRRHARPLLAFLAARCRRADLDDLHQEVWRKVWENLPGRFDGRDFRAWLYRIARNRLIDEGRKRRPGLLDGEAEPVDGRHPAPEDVLVEAERGEALRRCLDRLDPRSATLVRARLGGDDYEAIAPGLGLRADQAHRLFYKAKDWLRDCLARALR